MRSSGPAAPASIRAWAPWLTVLGLTAIAAAIRVATAGHTMFADEMSTYWIITAHNAGVGGPALHGLGGVLSLVGHAYPGGATAEISPPLYFAAAWLTTQLGHAPELVRAPSLLAGVGIIPLTYLLGVRTIGRVGAILAAAFAALCPFLIYYSGEARAYSMMMFLLLVSTLAMLRALDTGDRVRWWALYAVASAGAMLAHYTAAFLLAGQLLWLLWAHREAWRAALLANVGAALLFAPWIPSAIRQFKSPTLKILSAISPFDFTSARISLEHWILGFPYSNVSVRQVPGLPVLVLLSAALALSLGALLWRAWRVRGSRRLRIDERLGLVLVLALSVPVGEALESAVGTHTFGGRNLAGSTVGVLLALAALVIAAPRHLRYLTTGLALAAFVLAALKMLEPTYQRPDLAAAASYIERQSRPGDVVIDGTVAFSPGPLSPLDLVLRPGIPVLRAGNPAERDHPFGFLDPLVSLHSAVRTALSRYPHGRVFLVRNQFPNTQTKLAAIGNSRLANLVARSSGGQQPNDPLPPAYREVAKRFYAGFPKVRVQVFARAG